MTKSGKEWSAPILAEIPVSMEVAAYRCAVIEESAKVEVEEDGGDEE